MNNDTYEQQLRKDLQKLDNQKGAKEALLLGIYDEKPEQDEDRMLKGIDKINKWYFDTILALFDTYAARKAGLGDSEKPQLGEQYSEIKSLTAMEFATKAHEGQLRDGGEPYIKHPMQVAQLISLVTDDDELIAAAWLHDVLEDTPVSYEVLVARFGKRVADLVNEVTHDGDDTHGYYFPRLNSQVGIMLKFADRLSNVSDMNAWSDKRRNHYMKRSVFWKQEQVTDLTTDSPDTNDQASQSRNINHKEPNV